MPWLLQQRGWVAFGLPESWQAVGAFGPAVAACLVIRRTAGAPGLAVLWRSLTIWRGSALTLVLTLLLPLGFLLLAAGLVTLQTGSAPSLHSLATGRLGNPGAVWHLILVAALLQSLGEEPGWRGFLLPKMLDRFGPLRATMVLFPVWWLWHLPFFLSRPEFGWPQFFGFGVGILSASVWLTFLWQRTQSVLLAVGWHATLNIARGIALGFSTPLFLAYGLVVAGGALCIVGWWLVTPTPAPTPAGNPG